LDGFGLRVGTGLGVGVGTAVWVGVGVRVGVDVAVAVGVGLGLAVTTLVLVGVGDVVAVTVIGVPVLVGRAVAAGTCVLPTRNQSKSAGRALLLTAVFEPPQAKTPTWGCG
jgi:hypothetical protein